MDLNAPTFVGAIKDVVTIALEAFLCYTSWHICGDSDEKKACFLELRLRVKVTFHKKDFLISI